MSSYLIGLLVFGMALAIIIPLCLTQPIARRFIITAATFAKSLSLLLFILFSRLQGTRLLTRNYFQGDNRSVYALRRSLAKMLNNVRPKVKFGLRNGRLNSAPSYIKSSESGEDAQPSYSIDPSGEYCEIIETAPEFKGSRDFSRGFSDDSPKFSPRKELPYQSTFMQGQEGEIYHFDAVEDTVSSVIPDMEASIGIKDATDTKDTEDNRDTEHISVNLSVSKHPNFSEIIFEEAETETIFVASDVQVEAELHYSFDLDTDTLIPAETLMVDSNAKTEDFEITDAITELSMDERYHTDELVLEQELASLPVVNLSNYTINPRTVTHIPELEVLEPVFFGSPLLIDTESLQHKNITEDAGEIQHAILMGQGIDSEDYTQVTHSDEDSVAETSVLMEAEVCAPISLDEMNFPTHVINTIVDETSTPETVAQDYSEDNSSISMGETTTIHLETEYSVSHEKSLSEEYEPSALENSSRQHRGGFDPEIDSKIHAAKYRVRQRNVVIVAIIAFFGISSSFFAEGTVDSMVLTSILGTSLCPLIGYLLYLRHTVRLEHKIRSQRSHRYERNQRSRNITYGDIPDLHSSNLVIVEIDDEDPIFDHLEMHYGPINKENPKPTYHRAAQAV